VAVVSSLAAALVLAAPRRARRNGRSARVVACAAAAEEEAKAEVKAEAEEEKAEEEEAKAGDKKADDEDWGSKGETVDDEELAEEEPKAEKKKATKWACSGCGANNFAQVRECSKCGGKKPSRPEAEKLAERAEAKDQVAKVMDEFIRAQADLQNYRRSHNDAMSRAKDLGKQDALRKLVPFSNDIDAALVAPEGMTEKEAKFFESYSILFNKVHKVWEKFGIKAQEVAVGDKYDLNSHKKVEERKAEGDETPGTILSVVTPGFALDGKVLVPAEVSIIAVAKEEAPKAKAKEEAAEESAEEAAEEPAEEEKAKAEEK